MRCTLCQTMLPPGVVACVQCGTPVVVEADAFSSYDPEEEKVAYIDYASAVAPGVIATSSTVDALSRERSSAGSDASTNYPSPSVYEVPPSFPQAPQFHPPPQDHSTHTRLFWIVLPMLVVVLIAGSTVMIYALSRYQAEKQQEQLATATSSALTYLNATARVANDPQALYTQATSGVPMINDPLTNPAISSWNATLQSDTGYCDFADGAYHVVAPQANDVFPCSRPGTFSNFAFQVQMRIIKGDTGGIYFRSDAHNHKGYGYRAVIEQTGIYLISMFSDETRHAQVLVAGHLPSTFKTGLNQTNLVTLIALGKSFYLYVNKQIVTIAHDSTYNIGLIALMAGSVDSDGTDVAFNAAQLWELQ